MRLLAEDTWASILVLRATSAWALLKRVDLTVTGLPLVPAGEAVLPGGEDPFVFWRAHVFGVESKFVVEL